MMHIYLLNPHMGWTRAAAQGLGPGPSPCKDLVSIYAYVCIYVDVYNILGSFTLWIY